MAWPRFSPYNVKGDARQTKMNLEAFLQALASLRKRNNDSTEPEEAVEICRNFREVSGFDLFD